MAAATSSKLMNRANGVLGLFIGIFGALAILGVFFKIAKLPNYELFMTIGFIGEAGAFIIMGLFALIKGFTGSSEPAAAGAAAGAMAPALPRPDLDALGEEFREEMRQVTAAFREEMRERLHARFTTDFDTAAEAVGQDMTFLGTEVRELGEEMQRARTSFHAMRSQLDHVATGRLAEDAGALSQEMHHLCEEVSAAGASAERMRSDLEVMANRFYAFNHMGDARARNGQAEQVAWIAGRGEHHENSEVTR